VRRSRQGQARADVYNADPYTAPDTWELDRGIIPVWGQIRLINRSNGRGDPQTQGGIHQIICMRRYIIILNSIMAK